ncbi:MAG: kelch repeat-containing protein [Planctomycetales bacterium]
MKQLLVTLAAASIFTAIAFRADSAEEEAPQLPLHEWAAVPGDSRGYVLSLPVYVSSRGQVLHWGQPIGRERHNAVLAFDAASGMWTPDSPSAPANELDKEESGFASNGAPRPFAVSNGACFIPKRNEIIFGGTLAYHVETRKWRDLKPTWILGGKAYRDVRPVTALSYCYDPAGDRLIAFPHHGILGTFETVDQVGGPEMARLPGGHRVLGHYGTLVYDFKDNTWRQIGDELGEEPVRDARRTLMAVAEKIGRASDAAHSLRRKRDVAMPDSIVTDLREAVRALPAVDLPSETAQRIAAIRKLLEEGATAAAAGGWDAVVDACGKALWSLDSTLDAPLSVEPPARTGTQMIYVPSRRVVVMFGGQTGIARYDLHPPRGNGDQPGALSDTWIFDCEMNQWRDVSKSRRPPETVWPRTVYDPASGRVLLVRRDAIWGFDLEREEWSLLLEPKWPGDVARFSTYAFSNTIEEVALDEKRGTLMLLQPDQRQSGRRVGGNAQQTFRMRLDLARAEPRPIESEWRAPPPIAPHEVPEDDPAIVAKLKELPANVWVDSGADPTPPNKGYTNAACDPVRGHVYFFGGGHGDYQINDVAIYSPGANRWAFAPGDNNDWIPPSGWDGWCMGLRGGANAGHQRNYYCALDGRMYKGVGTCTARWPWKGADRDDTPRFAYFYDVDRRGVWRTQPVARVDRDSEAPGIYGWPHMATPDGRVVGFGGRMEPYNGRFSDHVNFFSYDIHTRELTLRSVPKPYPSATTECRPFCFLPDKGEQGSVFVLEPGEVCRSWLYDIAANEFRRLNPANEPSAAKQLTVEYLLGQNAVFALVERKQWVYSFARNQWAELPVRSNGREVRFAGPYAQCVYSAKYGVLVNLPATQLMRPDVEAIEWD